MPESRIYELVRYSSAKADGLTDALAVYIRNIAPSVRTNTNEITFWLEHFRDAGADEFYVFGFRLNDVTIGYSEVAYFEAAQLFMIDYLVIDAPYRKNNTFYEFVDQLKAYLEKRRPEYRFAVAEITRRAESAEPPPDSRLMIRLMKLQGFKVIHAPYVVPRLGVRNVDTETPATLLLLAREEIDSIHVHTYRTIVSTIYINYYGRWYGIYTDEAADYDAYLQRLLAMVTRKLPKERVSVNGYREQLTAKSDTGDPGHDKLLFFVGRLLLYFALFTLTLLASNRFLALDKGTFVIVYLCALLALLAIAGIVSVHARTMFYRLLGAIRDVVPLLVQKKTKLQANARTKGKKRKVLSKTDHRDALTRSDEKRSRNDDTM